LTRGGESFALKNIKGGGIRGGRLGARKEA